MISAGFLDFSRLIYCRERDIKTQNLKNPITRSSSTSAIMSSVAQALGISDDGIIQIISAYLNLLVLDIFSYGLYTMVFLYTLLQIGEYSYFSYAS